MSDKTEVLSKTLPFSLDDLYSGKIEASQEEQQPATVGKLSRYQVVANTDKSSTHSEHYELAVYAENVSLFDRFINLFTGFLDKEKTDAMIDFIGTGTLQAMGTANGDVAFYDFEGDFLDAQLYVFEQLMSKPTTTANYGDQIRAEEALRTFLNNTDSLTFAQKKEVKAALDKYTCTHVVRVPEVRAAEVLQKPEVTKKVAHVQQKPLDQTSEFEDIAL